MKKFSLTLLLIPMLVSCGVSASEIDSVVQRCQESVAAFAKYPGTADWVQINLAEEQNGKIYINGNADFDNDAGNPIRTKYSCTLDLETDNWVRRPVLEPKYPVGSKWKTSRWGGADSPMQEQYGDSMSLED